MILTNIDIESAELEIKEGKLELEDIVGKPITKFAYPRGYWNDSLKLLVREAGFFEARTMKMGIINIDAYDNFEIPVSAQNYPRPEYDGNIYEGIIRKFDEAKKFGNYFNLVIHTDDILRFHQRELIDKVFKYISANK
jgi:peptidoglycan/xylan/chitin deacetylase (PgdA/CDA1 family)